MAQKSYLSGAVSTRKTSQRDALVGRESEMKLNRAGGMVFKAGEIAQFRRFLILGTEQPTYYAGSQEMTKENAKNALTVIRNHGVAAVREIVEISEAGRAPKNDQAIYALAIAAGVGDEETRRAALNALPLVCRTGTHLFQFAEFVKEFRGWGPALRRALARWYDDKEADQLAYQLVKYRQRNGWTHRDVLRVAHPTGHPALYDWLSGREASNLPRMIEGFEKAQSAKTVKEIVGLIREYGLPREALPTEFVNKSEVQMALLEAGMPMTALIRNLGNLGKSGLLKPMSAASKIVVEQLGNKEALNKARIHPVSVLVAMLTYGSGHSVRGDGSWTVVPQVKDALEGAFYDAFGNVEATGKNTMLGIDVSGSMGGWHSYGYGWGSRRTEPPAPGFTPCMGAAAMAMVTARAEPNYFVGGFCHQFVDLGITARDTLDSAMNKAMKHNFGGTDAAVSMQFALRNRIPVETFVIYTDNETWAGEQHASQALAEYRRKMGIDARLVSVAFTATDVSIADPKDAGMLDVVGFDSAAPQIISDFSAGRI